MAKSFEFNWRPLVPDRLLNGDLFDRWEEVGLNLSDILSTDTSELKTGWIMTLDIITITRSLYSSCNNI